MNAIPKVDFFSGRKESKILWWSGYRHTLEKRNRNCTSIWRCHNRKCRGSITWNEQDETVIRVSDHQCISDTKLYEKEKIIEELKQAVSQEHGPIPQLYDNIVRKYETDTESRKIIPPFSAVRDILYRARKKSFKVNMLIFKSLENIAILDKLKQDFIIIENGDEDKILVLCRKEAHKSIRCVTNYFGYSTFRNAPEPFSHIYTIHGDIGNTRQPNIVPLIFALIPNKEESTFIRLFKLLKENFPDLCPSYFQTNYELATIKAVRQVFPEVTIRGSLFHCPQKENSSKKKGQKALKKRLRCSK